MNINVVNIISENRLEELFLFNKGRISLMKIEFLIAYQTVVRKEFVRFARIWIQTILPSVITIFLYITIFGNFIGDRIGSISDFDYIDYII